MQFISKLTSYFVAISTNTERRTRNIDYSNMAKILYYFIQLIGYIYSQFERKAIQYYENDFLAQISQQSSIPFILIIIHYDPLTIFAYMCIFIVMLSIFAITLFQIILKSLPSSSPINKFIKFYFQNFQWFFLTPFNECMIGVITCGRQSYLIQHSVLEPSQCLQQIPYHYVIISFLGVILVSLSGIVSVFYFRNYDFLQAGLLRKFSYINFIIIFLHQLLIILSFWKQMYQNEYVIIYTCYFLIMFCLLLDVFTQLPFGFTTETIFYSQILITSIFFGALITYWMFSDQNDGIIFLTSCIIIPLIFTLNQAYFRNQFDEENIRFCSNIRYNLSEFTLEYFVLISHPITMTKDSYFQFIRYLNIHCQTCNDINCPCNKLLRTFITSNQTIDCEPLYVWIQYQFQKLIKMSMNKECPEGIFEQLTIKFVTFLKKYRSNQYLSFKNIQDVVISYQKQQKNKSNSLKFFIHLTRQIQLDSKLDLEQQNRNQHQISKNEFKSLNDLNLFLFYEIQIMQNIIMALHLQKELWTFYINGIIKNYDDLMVQLKKVSIQEQLVQKDYNYFNSQREDQKHVNILIIRLQLLISIVCLDDINKQLSLAKQLQQMQQEQFASSPHQFHILNYINGTAVTIQQLISFEEFDIKNIIIKENCKSFFGYDHSDEPPKLKDLIPHKIRSIHKGLVDKFLFLGYSSKIYSSQDTFIVNKNQFIEKVSMSLTVLFPVQGRDYLFYVFAHLLKKQGFQQNSQILNQQGYILIDKNFNIFGISQNIQNKISQFSQTEIDFCQTYDKLSIFYIFPELLIKLQEKFTEKQLKNSRLQDEEIIIEKNSMNFVIPNYDIFLKAVNQKNKNKIDFDIKNRHILNYLIEFEKQLTEYQNNCYTFQVEFTMISKILNPQVYGIQKDFLYFLIDIQFQNDLKSSKCTFQKFPSESDNEQYIQITQQKIKNQTQLAIQSFESENREFLSQKYIRVSSTTTEKRSSNNLNQQISFIRQITTNTKLPYPMSNLLGFFLLQILLIISIIIALLILFDRKSSMQSDCIRIITLDLDFVDAYSQIMSGSRHIIYYRDFYLLINDSILSINDQVLNFSKKNKLYQSWNHLNLGLNRLIKIYEQNRNLFQQDSDDYINIQIINGNLQNKLIQPVSDLTTYFQIMFQIFYLTLQSSSQNISNYLPDSIDTYSIQISRSLVYYNYFDVVKIFQRKIDTCKNYNNDINQYLDSTSNYIFYGFYILAIIITFSQTIYCYKVSKQIKFNFDIFSKCDSQDGNLFIRKNDQLRYIVVSKKVLLKKQGFLRILEKPFVDYDEIKYQNQNQSSGIVKTFNQQDKHILIRNRLSKLNSTLTLSLICFIGLSYGIGFQIYYNVISKNVQPFNEEAIDSQQLRLTSITTINKYDQYLIKILFECYYNLSLNDTSFTITQNILSDYLILNQLDFNNTLLSQEIEQFQHLNFTNFLFNSKTFNTISENDQTEILSHDACILTGCNMYTELLQQRMFNEILNPYFYQGIVNLHYILSQIYYEIDINLQYQQSNLDKFMNIKNIFDEHNYMIYILWGLDIIQFQIGQFCQYFVNVSLDAISNLTINSTQNIIIFGLLTIFGLIVLQLLFIYYQIQRYHLSKSLLKLIPLEIIFKKNIYKQLVLHEKRSRIDLSLQF